MERPYNPNYIVNGNYNDFEKNIAEATKILSTSNRPDAIFCFSDAIAVAVYLVAQKMRLNIPKDLAIVGFDNQRVTNYLNPNITTVAMPLKEIGEISMNLLFDLIAGKEVNAKPRQLPCSLIVRSST